MNDDHSMEWCHLKITRLEAEYAKLWQMYGDMEDGRDKLRKAVRGIKNMPPSGTWDDTFHAAPSWWRSLVRQMHDIADAALQAVGDE